MPYILCPLFSGSKMTRDSVSGMAVGLDINEMTHRKLDPWTRSP